MTVIEQLLEITPNQYEKMALNHWHQWCHYHAYDMADCNKLMCSQPLLNWWLQEYEWMEHKFALRAIEFHQKAASEVLRQYHAEHVVRMVDFYSKPLMKAARKQKPIIPQFN